MKHFFIIFSLSFLLFFLFSFKHHEIVSAQGSNTYFNQLIQNITNTPQKSLYNNIFNIQTGGSSGNVDLVNLLKTAQYGQTQYNPDFLHRPQQQTLFPGEKIEVLEEPLNQGTTAVTAQSVAKLTENIDSREGHVPCSGATNALQCRRDLFVSCASSYDDGEVMPLACEQFSPYQYSDFISYADKNPAETVSDYFESKLAPGQELLTNIKYEQNETPLKDVFRDSVGEKSGWGTWFGHGPKGQYDKLAGTSQFGGWTGGCGAGNKNPGCYQTRNPNTCIVSIPKSTMQEFYGINGSRESIRTLLDQKPLMEIKNTATGKCAVVPLGDVGPGEGTGKAIDMTGCVMRQLGGSGMMHAHFRPLKNGEKGCGEDTVKELPFGGIVEKVLTCNCNKPDKNVIVVSDKVNRKRLIGVFQYGDLPNFAPKEGDEVIGMYVQAGGSVSCAIRPTPSANKCLQEVVGVSQNKYSVITVAGTVVRAGSTQKAPKKELSI